MLSLRFRQAWHGLRMRWMRSVVQDCPPELSACEVCRKLQCTNESWLSCEKRLKAERAMRAGDRGQIEGLRRQHACGCAVDHSAPAADGGAVT